MEDSKTISSSKKLDLRWWNFLKRIYPVNSY